ncbi:hypothetical protein B0T22DRAFT_81587 [Podospora appendiculata]|uniref:MARVEL domain-containing protein n=1 Tax=Podospora appendiculata TaxID=314037 RepID=A0AAE1CHF6_9PEZI|nr:hypothetical protein B0T22DRAFT_81587 [Podospora appendiculata]
MSASAPSKYSAVRPAGREHIPIYPNGFIALRIVQLVFSVIVLGLAAFGIYYLAFDGDCFILAVAIMTLITSIYHIVAWFGAPNIFNYWAILSLDILLLIMWLASFALLASQVAWFFAVTSYSYDYYSGYSYSTTKGDNIVASCLAAAAGLGGLEFALHIISLSIHSVMLHRHRAAGLHCSPGTPPGPANGGSAAEKPAVFPTYQQQAPQPAPAYMPAQQPYAVPQQLQPQPQYPQYPQPQQQYYAQQQQTPAPLLPQQTGGSFVPQQQPQQQQPPLPMQPPANQPYQQPQQ